MKTSTKRAAALLMLTSTVGLTAGCGDSDSKSGNDDAKEIAAVIEKVLKTTDPEVKCVETVTKGFVSTVYGDLGTCKKAEAPKPDDDPNDKVDSVSVSGVKVDGDTATATVTESGGDSDGATGEISFEKEDDAWKVSKLGIDYLRSSLTKSLASSAKEADSPFSSPEALACVQKGFDDLDEAAFRAAAYSGIADSPNPTLLGIFETCTTGASTDDSETADDDVSLLRQQFEKGIRESALKDGATTEQIDCVVKELRTAISEDEIIEQIGKGSNVSPELAKTTAKAIAACG